MTLLANSCHIAPPLQTLAIQDSRLVKNHPSKMTCLKLLTCPRRRNYFSKAVFPWLFPSVLACDFEYNCHHTYGGQNTKEFKYLSL